MEGNVTRWIPHSPAIIKLFHVLSRIQVDSKRAGSSEAMPAGLGRRPPWLPSKLPAVPVGPRPPSTPPVPVVPVVGVKVVGVVVLGVVAVVPVLSAGVPEAPAALMQRKRKEKRR